MASPYQSTSLIRKTFGVFFWSQTYLNILYLMLAFPLGIAYFVVLVTGISVGVGTLVIWVGVPILVLVFLVSWGLTGLERELAVRLLRQDIPLVSTPESIRDDPEGAPQNLTIEERVFIRMWRRLKNHLAKPATWTGLLYLFAKFPIGIASFVITTVLFALSFGFIAAPLLYRSYEYQIGRWRIDSLSDAFISLAAGLVILLISPHLLNLWAFLIGQFARFMLSPGLHGHTANNSAS